MTSDFELSMGQDVECRTLCKREVDREGVKWGRWLIENGYVAEWILDNLPGATSFVTVDRSRKYYASGFKIGYQDYSSVDGKLQTFIHNHFTIVIRWGKAPGKAGEQGGEVIVGFEVYPKSISPASRKESGCPR
jgi:transmembrane 9 superfamily protein 2/4